MSRIRGKNTEIENTMKKLLSSNHLKFVQHPKIFGNPDFVVGKRTVIFCDGDFWHGHDYEKKKKPPGGFWRNKIKANMKRDRSVSRKLRSDGWSVLRFWEHDIEKRPEFCMNKIRRFTR